MFFGKSVRSITSFSAKALIVLKPAMFVYLILPPVYTELPSPVIAKMAELEYSESGEAQVRGKRLLVAGKHSLAETAWKERASASTSR